jgi:hypothetical protein
MIVNSLVGVNQKTLGGFNEGFGQGVLAKCVALRYNACGLGVGHNVLR